MTVYGFNEIEIAMRLKQMALASATPTPTSSGGTTQVTPTASIYAPFLKVLVTSTIAAAAYNTTSKKITGVSTTVKRMFRHTDDDGTWTYNPTAGQGEMTVKSFYLTSIDITSGYARFGYVRNKELIIADCEEFSLT